MNKTTVAKADLIQDLAGTSEGEDFEFSPIVYFCKDCKALVEVIEGRKMKFKCKTCKGKNIAFGTKRSISNFYKVSEKSKKEEKEKKSEEKK